MVDEIPKLSPELFTLGGVEMIKRVRPRPDDSKEEASEAEDEGLMAEREQVGRDRPKRDGFGSKEDATKRGARGVKAATSEESAASRKEKKESGSEGEDEGDVKHVDVKA